MYCGYVIPLICGIAVIAGCGSYFKGSALVSEKVNLDFRLI